MNKRQKDELIAKVIVYGICFIGFGLVIGLGLFIEHLRYEAYVQMTHQHMSFFKYMLLSKHLRVTQ